MTGIITNGDCIPVMAAMPAASVYFILTDPPYLVNYRDRSGRRVHNDNAAAWLQLKYLRAHILLQSRLPD